jgi:catechol 2,3-dioxygenase-like lactoylglutathione lyase family enzyme
VRGGVWFKLGTQQLHLGVEKDFRPALKAHPAFLVNDLNGLRARLQQHGYVPYDDEPLAGYQRFYVADPFGNRLELLEPVAR